MTPFVKRYGSLTLLLLLLLAWGLTDVRKRASDDHANPSSHRSDVLVYTRAGAAFFDEETNPYAVTNPRGWHYLYPPLFAMVLAPLDRLPGSEQGFVFFLISLGLLYGSIVETARLARISGFVRPDSQEGPDQLTIPRWVVWLAILATLGPIINCLQRGQVAPFTLYPLLLGTRLTLETRGWKSSLSGGVALALPIAIKLTPALPVAYLGWVLWVKAVQTRNENHFLVRLNTALGTSVGVALGLALWLLVIPGLLVGWSENMRHLETWTERVVSNRDVGGRNDFYLASRRNQSLHNGARLLIGTFQDEPAPDAISDVPGRRFRSELNAGVPISSVDRTLLAIRVGVVLLLLIGGMYLARSRHALALSAALGFGAVGSLVFSPLSWGHHYVIAWPGYLFIPLLFIKSGLPTHAKAFSASCALLVVAHYLSVDRIGSIGLLGVGTAIWLISATIALPLTTRNPS